MVNFITKRIRTGERTICKDTLMTGKYPGLASTAHLIAEYIPKCKIYVEPFAGLGRLAKHVKADIFILNDKSDYAFNFLSGHFNAKITNLDFEECFRLYDSEDTYFGIDPPWRKQIYENMELPFCDRTPKEYYSKLYEILPKIKGDWLLCMDKSQKERGKIDLEIPYYEKTFDSKKTLFKKKIGTHCLSNKPFIRHNQYDLMEFT